MSKRITMRPAYVRNADGEYIEVPTFGVQTPSGGAVESVNGKTGAVVLTAEDVGALPDDTVIPPAVTDEHINSLIDAKLTPIDAAVSRLEAAV